MKSIKRLEFPINLTLLENSHSILSAWPRLTWLIGGSCSGKSTLSRALAARLGVERYDVDEAVFGRFHFDPRRHPATAAWGSAEDPLGWMISHPWDTFSALYRAANAETLDLLAAELAGRPATSLIVDGGISHPSVLAQVIPAARIVCLETTDEVRAREWETAEGRAWMKNRVLGMPDGQAMWRRFLEYDRRLTALIGRESREHGIPVFTWDRTTTVEELMGSVLQQVRFAD
jgi:hypothetical protein